MHMKWKVWSRSYIDCWSKGIAGDDVIPRIVDSQVTGNDDIVPRELPFDVFERTVKKIDSQHSNFFFTP